MVGVVLSFLILLYTLMKVYYYYHQMEAQWKGNNFKGGLAGLDARTKESFTKEDKAKLEDLADQNKITIFGKL